MPQLLFIAAIGAGVYAGLRAAKAVVSAMEADPERATADVNERARAVAAKDLGALDLDPHSGLYRPRR